MWDTLVVSEEVVDVGVSVWVALSEYELWLSRSWAGAVAWLVWVSLVAGVVLFSLGLEWWPWGGCCGCHRGWVSCGSNSSMWLGIGQCRWIG